VWDAVIQDLIPAGDYDFTTDTAFKNAAAATPCSTDASNWTLKDGTSNMCTKWWRIGYSGIACVEVTGHITRPFDRQPAKAPNTDVCDFSIDYVKH